MLFYSSYNFSTCSSYTFLSSGLKSFHIPSNFFLTSKNEEFGNCLERLGLFCLQKRINSGVLEIPISDTALALFDSSLSLPESSKVSNCSPLRAFLIGRIGIIG